MSVNGHCFVEWREQFVSRERGNRVVHYFLKDSAGDCSLAVVGTERSLRHMSYVVAEEFVQLYGIENSIRPGFKWRSRREVVDWLTSMLSKQNYLEDQHKLHNGNTTQGSNSSNSFRKCGDTMETEVLDNMGYHPRNLKDCTSDIVWLGNAWACGKQLKHYPAFCRNGTTIKVQSFVLVMAKEENHYIAYLEDMYEDKKGQRKVKVRWFHRNEEVRGVIPLRHCHPKEVFITPYVQVISAECVDGPTTVLTRDHYKNCAAVFPSALGAKIHMCFRQFRSNKMKPFELSKLHGYFDQPIISCLGGNFLPRPGFSTEKTEELGSGDKVKLRNKRPRIGEGLQFWADQKGISSLKLLNCQPFYLSQLKINEKIELLCQDSGIRGCWFRCTILQVSQKCLKVIYDDVQNEDDSGNLEEWIPAMKLALPDKLGMRGLGRPTIRPAPLPSGQADLVVEIGAAVDAWWNDGWWEGVIAGVDRCLNETLLIYFPGENLLLNIHKKDLRMSRDWIGGHWIDVKPEPDILSVISADLSLKTQLSLSWTISKQENSKDIDISRTEVSANPDQRIVGKAIFDSIPSGKSDGLRGSEVQIISTKSDENTEYNRDNVSQDVVGDVQYVGDNNDNMTN